jgi:acyl-CoA synthetase (AMP-forming)/AMP-acid ligase II
MTTIGAVLRTAAKRHNAQICLRDGDLSLTYEELFDRASRFGGTLRTMGVQHGDRVLLSMENCWQAVVAIVGSLLAGAIVAPTNVGASRRELLHWAALVEPSTIVAAQGPLARMDADGAVKELSGVRLTVDAADGGRGDIDFSDAVRRGEAWDGLEQLPSDPALILFTSGTTGYSKGVTRTHEVVLQFIERWEKLVISGDDVVMNFLPLNHQAGLLLSVLGPMCIGAEIVLLRKFTVDGFWAAAVEHGVTWAVTMPPVPQLLVNSDVLDCGMGHRLRSTLGAGPATDWLAFEDRYGLGMTTGYGSTESAMVTISPTGREAGWRLEGVQGGSYCGAPLSNWTKVRVMSNDGRAAGVAQVGELQLKGGGLFSEYWNAPEATTRAFTADGWFKTGDRGYLGAEGDVYLIGRTDDRIRRNGENIDPVEIETVLKEHSAVADAGVTAIPDDLRGAEMLACVVRQANSTVTFAALIEHCRAHLTSFKVPRYLEFRDELPRTAGTLRIQRQVLREQADRVTWFDRYA